MSYTEFLTINKLCEKLPEAELKAIQVYFDDYIDDKFDKKYINVQILFLSLVYKDNTQKIMTYKEFRDLCPGAIWLKCPQRSFDRQVFNGLQKKLFKVYIKADRIKYKSSYYHECVAKEVPDQSKLNKFIKDRSDAKLQIFNELAEKCTIDEDDIDSDIF